MAIRAFEKFSIWGIRFLQLCFSIVLIGVFSWFVHETHHAHFKTPHEVSVPLAFSVLAMLIAFFSITAVCFLGHSLMWIAAILDVLVFIGYLVSAILYRHNYHILGYNNELRNFLIYCRQISGYTSGHIRITNLVRLGAALIIIQLILFFITMLLSLSAARSGNVHDGTTVTTGEKRGMFGRRNRGVTTSTV